MTLGLLLTSLALGLRHGIDWDHIAAIVDLTGTADSRRRGFALSLLYALGHASVVFLLGALIIVTGVTIPDSMDAWMGRIVGSTLIALGVWIIVGLLRKGRTFRLRSRWMLIIDGTFAGLRRVRGGRARRHVAVAHTHDHEHVAGSHEHAAAHDHAHLAEDAMLPAELPAAVASGGSAPRMPQETGHDGPSRTHVHAHRHEFRLASDARYGNGTAAGIGMLHGVGIESPTQIALFVASTTIVGTSAGLLLLGAWVIGLVLANSGLAVLAGFGLLRSGQSFAVYATVAVVVGFLSIVVGMLFVIGVEILPAIPT